MGAAAFVMAETLGVKYPVIIKAAVIPALIYYLGIILQVQMRAVAFVAALLLIDSTLLTDVIGLGLAAAIILLQHFKRKRERRTTAAA